MEILIAFDGDDAGRTATLKAIPKILHELPKHIVAYEFLPGVVKYDLSLSYHTLMRLKDRRKQKLTNLIDTWHTELRRIPDWELEAWVKSLMRVITSEELEGRNADFSKDTLAALRAEVERRIAEEHESCVKYEPGTEKRQRFVQNRVELIRRYYSGEEFIHLFARITGISPFPVGRNRWKYACPVHGDGVDKKPAGSIDADRGLWHCFVCDSGGDLFHLLYAWPPHLTFKEAIDELWSWMPEGAKR